MVCLRSISVSVIINYTNMAATSHVKLDLIFENIALFVYIHGINSHFKCSFENILEKYNKIFPCGALLLNVMYEVFIKVPLFQETCSATKKIPVARL